MIDQKAHFETNAVRYHPGVDGYVLHADFTGQLHLQHAHRKQAGAGHGKNGNPVGPRPADLIAGQAGYQ